MRIGILTFHCAHNYGAVLQCYALQETLKRMGHEVEVINYRPTYLTRFYNVFLFDRFKSKNPYTMLRNTVREMLIISKRIKRHRTFDRFIHTKLQLSAHIDEDNIPANYDLYIMGSDQIWNPKITRGFAPVYFGDFKFEKGKRKYVSYAASMEANTLDEEAEVYFKQALRHLDAISVRESQLATMLRPLTDKPIETVVDPTLLADRQIWDIIAQKPNIQEKYVLVYQVREDKNTLRIAHHIAKKMKAVVVEVTAKIYKRFDKYNIQCASPEEFLGWIKHASCVVTTSFHGTAFSVIYNRPFYCIELGDGWDTRSKSLLSAIGLEACQINQHDTPELPTVDFTKANLRLAAIRENSMKFLMDAIKNGES